MRNAFRDAIAALAAADERIWLLTGDLGYTVLEGFRERFPDRFVNVGVAEQNMTGVAAGLALSGKIVFTYSIANFPIVRCLEQVRNDVCYHNLNVNIVAVGGGVVYGPLGYTHHAVEDLAIARALPNITVVAPGDPVEVRLATRALASRPGPSYLRLGRATETVVHREEPAFEIGKPIVLREGNDVALVAVGGVLANVAAAAERLAADGIAPRVVSLHTLKPLDAAVLAEAVAGPRHVFVVAEHMEGGGPTELATGLLTGRLPSGVHVHGLCLHPEALKLIGRREYILAENGLDADGIAAAVRRALGLPVSRVAAGS
jgi:transketolase